jgi:hypothetical protein
MILEPIAEMIEKVQSVITKNEHTPFLLSYQYVYRSQFVLSLDCSIKLSPTRS